MPGKVKVKIIAGRNLPVMDRSADTTDAYVEIKLGNTTFKTDVCRKSLNPLWNSEWYRFEVDDSELQDEPLQIRLMDYDVYSANDAIGKVYLDLNPLLLPPSNIQGTNGQSARIDISLDLSNMSSTASGPIPSASAGGCSFAGWIPVFDTMHGIRGEVHLIVKVELFSDASKFRQSSCGVQFFCSPAIPHGFNAKIIHGFVEELVVNDDPEYQWIDKIRTPRASNEARQTLFFKLSGEVQRRIGLKALELGANAVIGYRKCFDLEGESGIVVRGIGTAVTLMRQRELNVVPVSGEDGSLAYAPSLSRPASCSCLLRPSSSNTSMHSDHTHVRSHDRPRNMSLALASYHTPPFLLVIPPTPTSSGSLGIPSSQGCIHSRKIYSHSSHSSSGKERFPFLAIPHYKSSSKSGLVSESLSRSYRRHHSYSEAVRNDGSPDEVGDFLQRPGETRSTKIGFKALAKSFRTSWTKKLVKAFQKQRAMPLRLRKKDTARVVLPSQMRTHRRSSSDPTGDPGRCLELGLLDSVLEEAIEGRGDTSSSVGGELPIRCAQSDSCLVPGPTSDLDSSVGCGPCGDAEGYHISESSSSITFSSSSSSLSSSSSRSSELALSSAGPLSLSVFHPLLSLRIGNDGSSRSMRGSQRNVLDAESASSPVSSPRSQSRDVAGSPHSPSFRQAAVSKKRNSIQDHSQISLSLSLSKCYNGSSFKANPASNACPLAASALNPAPLACSSTDTMYHLVASSPSSPNSVTSSCPSRLPFPAAGAVVGGNINEDMRATSPLAQSTLNSKLSPTRLIANSSGMHRRSSDSDLSITPKGSSLAGSTGSTHGRHMGFLQPALSSITRPHLNQDSLDMVEYPFLTMSSYPAAFVLRLGGVVSSRCVKLLERTTNTEDHESRDTWWNELRMEVRSHARALACNVVLGYTEHSSICDDVCVLSASGTAAVISMNHHIGLKETNRDLLKDLTPLGKDNGGKELSINDQPEVNLGMESGVATNNLKSTQRDAQTSSKSKLWESREDNISQCSICHVPYSTASAPMPVNMLKCAICRKKPSRFMIL